MVSTVKSIAPITPTASTMPSKTVSSMVSLSTSLRSPVTQARSPQNYFNRLAPLGVSDAKPKSLSQGRIQEWHFGDNKANAWNSIAKYMPAIQTVAKKNKFNAAYLSGFSTYDDYFGALNRDFGAGELKTFQTANGPQTLYEYQYNNFLKYGSVNGPAMVSTFEFRDGKWWNTYSKRASYNKIGVLDLYAEIPGDMKTSYLARKMLTEGETESLFQLSRKNNLSQEAYKDLVKTTYAQKFFTQTAADIGLYADSLNGTTSAGPNVSSTAQYGSLFGSQLQSDLKNISGMLSNLGAAALYLGKGFATALGAGSGFMGSNEANVVTGGTSLFPKLDGVVNVDSAVKGTDVAGWAGIAYSVCSAFKELGRKSGRQSFFETLILSPLVLGIQMQNIFDNAIFGYVAGRREAHKYNLVNVNGKIIDSYGDVTDGKDAEGISIIASKTGASRDLISAILGSLYRYRVVEEMTRAIENFNSQLTSTGYFANVGFTEF